MTDSDVIADALARLLRRRTRAWLINRILDELPADVDAQTYPVLIGLQRFGPITAAALSTELDLDRSVISRRADRLARAGLVDVSVNTRDRREKRLQLNARGREIARLADNTRAEAIAQALGRWPEAHRAALAACLPMLVDALANAGTSGPPEVSSRER